MGLFLTTTRLPQLAYSEQQVVNIKYKYNYQFWLRQCGFAIMQNKVFFHMIITNKVELTILSMQLSSLNQVVFLNQDTSECIITDMDTKCRFLRGLKDNIY